MKMTKLVPFLFALLFPLFALSAPSLETKAPTGQLFFDYSGTNVGTSSYVQIMASTPNTTKINIFDSSGQTISLETDDGTNQKLITTIVPGGQGDVTIGIPAGLMLKAKSLTSTASSGFLVINFYY